MSSLREKSSSNSLYLPCKSVSVKNKWSLVELGYIFSRFWSESFEKVLFFLHLEAMMCLRKREKRMRLFVQKDEEGNNWFVDQEGNARKQLSWKEIAERNKVIPHNSPRILQSRLQSRFLNDMDDSNRLSSRPLFQSRNGSETNSRPRRERRVSSVAEPQSDTLSIESITSAVLEALGDLSSPSSDPDIQAMRLQDIDDDGDDDDDDDDGYPDKRPIKKSKGKESKKGETETEREEREGSTGSIWPPTSSKTNRR